MRIGGQPVAGGFTLMGSPTIVARRLAGSYRVIAPDLRGHGSSSKPREISAYPPDALVDDGFALGRL